MKLVERHIFNENSDRFKSLDEICYLSKNLYNVGLYEIRKEFELSGKWIRYNELEKKLRLSSNIDYISLPNNSSQQILMLIDKNLKSFFSALKAFKKNKKKFTGCPKFPNYKHKTKGRNIVIFTSNQFRLKDDGYIYFPKKSGLKPIKTKIKDNIQQVRIIPKNDKYIIEIIYNFNPKIKELNKEYLSIDLGMNNLATCIDTIGNRSFIINGRPIKSINQYYNKRLAYYKSKLKKYKNNRGEIVQIGKSRRINRLTEKRNNKIENYLHKSSKMIVDYCKKNHIDNVVLGKNDGWKQELNLGRKTNQNFVQIPFNKFESYLKYKLEKEGLSLKIREESYTSICSSFDMEEIKKQETYKGKRIERGLFKTSDGMILNADVNGALNILRKEIGDNFMYNKILSNRGHVVCPLKVIPL